jgi:hypothetical protein
LAPAASCGAISDLIFCPPAELADADAAAIVDAALAYSPIASWPYGCNRMGRHAGMWSELVAAIPGLVITDRPASPAALDAAPECLGHPLPDELAALYQGGLRRSGR